MSLNENPVFLIPGPAFFHIKSHFPLEHCVKSSKKMRKIILKGLRQAGGQKHKKKICHNRREQRIPKW